MNLAESMAEHLEGLRSKVVDGIVYVQDVSGCWWSFTIPQPVRKSQVPSVSAPSFEGYVAKAPWPEYASDQTDAEQIEMARISYGDY